MPVANRTRSREALRYKELHESIRKKRRHERCGAESSGVYVGERVVVISEEEEINMEEVDMNSLGGDGDDTRPILVGGSEDEVVKLLGRDDLEVKTSDEDESLQKAYGKSKRRRRKSTRRECNFVDGEDENGVQFVGRDDSGVKKGDGDIIDVDVDVDDEEREKDDDGSSETSLPLKFTFGIEESISPEKSEHEKELDNLWMEMEFALKASDIGSTASLMDEKEAAYQSSSCLHGNHQLFLYDEIGIVCKLCGFVKQEIRHVVPSFAKYPMERSGWSYYSMLDDSIYDELHDLELDFDSQYGLCPSYQAEGTVWDLVPGVKNSMFPHQREGFEFIWKRIAGEISLEELKNSTSLDSDNGCIISHAPGTGKTRLTIVFLDSYMRLYPHCRPVIIAPCSMLLTWEEEFQKWGIHIPFHNLNKPELSGKENGNASSMNRVKHGAGRVLHIRMVKLYSWRRYKGILGLSYGLFNKLINEESGKLSKKVSKILLELPGLFVFDEGHTPRNDGSGMFRALSRIKTERRIILSGTPFQNNFQELGNTLSLVFPMFPAKMHFEDLRYYGKKRGRKSIKAKANLASLMGSIGKGADDGFKDKKLKKLRDAIAPFVHIHKGNVLQESLPGLRHSVLVLRPDDFQKSLLEFTKDMKSLFEGDKGANSLFCLDYYVSLISVHPSLVPKRCFKQNAFLVQKDKLKRLRLIPEAGIKTKFLMILLQLSNAMNEKVLVFSEFIRPLTLIRDQLKHSFKWTEGKEVLYMDGKRDVKQRQSSINVFNDPTSEARILLASTKACCEGISLVGASRVVLLDVVWNPSVERQAISRAYRLGQKRIVYVYHLITSGTMEEDKICRQAEKVRLSNLVFSSSDGGDNKHIIAAGDLQDKLSSDGDGSEHRYVSEDLQDEILNEMVKQKKMIEKIIQQPKDSELIESFGVVDKFP